MRKLIILRWGNCPGLSWWAQCNHKEPYKVEAEELESERENVRIRAVVREKGRCYIAVFKLKGGVPYLKNSDGF